MFIRHKKRANNTTAIQIVANFRQKGKVVQKVLRHVGIAKNEQEVELLEQLAHCIQIRMQQDVQLSLFSAEELIDMVLRAREKQQQQQALKVDLKSLREERRLTIGIHQAYGKVYKQLNFHQVLRHTSNATQDTLRHIVMARLATPTSKRGAVSLLANDFGVQIDLQRVYRMMDHIDEKAIAEIQRCACQMTNSLLPGKAKVVFYDCTTLYFESFESDELKQNGFSKDGKHNQPQVLLALLVSEQGLPIGYEVFPGATFEGHTLMPVLEKIQARYQLQEIVLVADSGLLNATNCQELEAKGYKYILGARLRNLPQELQAAILTPDNYHSIALQGHKEDIQRIGDFVHKDRRLIVNHSAKRARKDAHEREKNIEKLRKRLAKHKSTKGFLSNSGYKKFLDLSRPSVVSVNEERVAAEARWDGLCGIMTNIKEQASQGLIAHYRGLWQIEACFRLQKHDLKIRPIFHWTPQRIKAHIAICFMAFTAQSYLRYRLKQHAESYSVEQIKASLMRVQTSILRDQTSNRCFAVPSHLNELSCKIYHLLELPRTSTPCEITEELQEYVAKAA